jgi:hypothetical protein
MKHIAEIILRGFKELDVILNRASRLGKQINVYLDPKGILPQIIEPDHDAFQTAVEAKRDLSQVAFSLTQLLPVIPKDEIRKRLRRLVSDNVLPQDNPERSPGRDAQFELLVAALCVRAQLDPVFDESPDLRCKLSDETFGLAVKRIKSPPERFDEGLQATIRKAADQIERSCLPGIIIIDVSQSLNPSNWRVPLEIADAQFDAVWGANKLGFKARFGSRLLKWTEGKHVLGVILIDTILRSHPTRGWLLELFGSSMDLCPFNERRRRQFASFDSRFAQAILKPGEIVANGASQT